MGEDRRPRDAGSLSLADRRWRAALLTLAAAFTLLSLWALLHAPRALDPARAGSLRVEVDDAPVGAWRPVKALLPGSPLAAAGVQVGDQIRFHRASDAPLWRALDTQETLRLDVRPAGGGAPRTLTVQPVPDTNFLAGRALASYVTGWAARLISLALGVLIVLRQPANVPLRGLALALICSAVFGSYFLPGGVLHDVVLWLRSWLDYTWALGLVWFTLRYPVEQPLWRYRATRVLFGGLLLAGFAEAVLRLSWRVGLWTDAGTAWQWLLTLLWPPVAYLSNFVSIAALLISCLMATGAMRRRLVAVATALIPWTATYTVVALLWEMSWLGILEPWMFVITDLGWLLGAVLLVWAVLRHRAFDFGVVLQRTVALSVVSTAVLTALGLARWLAERLLHELGLPRGLWVDLLLALIVVAAFAAVQRRLVARVDALVFRRWHEAAEALRAFVDRAAQVTEPAVLQQRFVAAVDAFAEAQGSALYVAEPDGVLRRVQGSLTAAPVTVDANDPLAIELRHGTRRVDLTRLTDSAVAACAEWAFVMSVRGRVSGVLLVSPRPDGVAYRPEELVQLEDSARRIGLDLESLRVAELERELAELRMRVPRTPLA